MKQTILFDLDDTLVHCNKYFNLVINQFANLMTDWFRDYGLTAQDVQGKQTEIDIAGVQVLGFKSEHFPQSFIETYRHFSNVLGRAASAVEEDTLWKLGLSVYELETEPYPFMEETLDRLAGDGHELHLYTGGEPLIQRRKIERFSLERYFGNRIYVRRHKNIEALENIVQTGDFDRRRTWMIGNSIRTDIVPALTAGIHAIHMKADSEWLYNIVGIDVQPKGVFLSLGRLPDIPPAIEGHIRRTEEEVG
ncbi:HAD family hydrolase [Paenibacillus darwinianus]|uniref:HAD family hydrolase n=1 Tax=Paenibacillus darwinianus TaxID=1380763 RepID=A0A9W5S180_9BACL|nr:HAD hydrolase-like protein [Paenibacillus darwinianus]EXX87737.1 HAD family hydrolase [Paenibacillus darwinianus]EXX89950.1 HAD family hydrolase [Paenibacillus darwinianus]EXX90796.1 HAD family hydrolase [Paenibacillus darwinianus]